MNHQILLTYFQGNAKQSVEGITNQIFGMTSQWLWFVFGAVISILPLRSPLKLPATLTVCKQSKRGKIVSFTVTCRSDLKKKKDTNSAGSPKILRNLASKRKCDLEPCKSILSELHRSF